MRPPVKLKAGSTGPLELTFFLKSELPNTNIRSFGKIRVDIYPPIPDPRNLINGDAMYCTFFSNVVTECEWTTVNGSGDSRSTILINTPQEFRF
jgi:hypothetical protein